MEQIQQISKDPSPLSSTPRECFMVHLWALERQRGCPTIHRCPKEPRKPRTRTPSIIPITVSPTGFSFCAETVTLTQIPPYLLIMLREPEAEEGCVNVNCLHVSEAAFCREHTSLPSCLPFIHVNKHRYGPRCGWPEHLWNGTFPLAGTAFHQESTA